MGSQKVFAGVGDWDKEMDGVKEVWKGRFVQASEMEESGK